MDPSNSFTRVSRPAVTVNWAISCPNWKYTPVIDPDAIQIFSAFACSTNHKLLTHTTVAEQTAGSVLYALQSLNPTLDLSFFPKNFGYDTHRDRMTGVFSATLSLCDELDSACKSLEASDQQGEMHFRLLNCQNMALPSMSLI